MTEETLADRIERLRDTKMVYARTYDEMMSIINEVVARLEIAGAGLGDAKPYTSVLRGRDATDLTKPFESFTDEAAARRRWKALLQHWNCHLFTQINDLREPAPTDQPVTCWYCGASEGHWHSQCCSQYPTQPCTREHIEESQPRPSMQPDEWPDAAELRRQLSYAYGVIAFGFTYNSFDFSVLRQRAEKWVEAKND